jgi:hypothetical protein
MSNIRSQLSFLAPFNIPSALRSIPSALRSIPSALRSIPSAFPFLFLYLYVDSVVEAHRILPNNILSPLGAQPLPVSAVPHFHILAPAASILRPCVALLSFF